MQDYLARIQSAVGNGPYTHATSLASYLVSSGTYACAKNPDSSLLGVQDVRISHE